MNAEHRLAAVRRRLADEGLGALLVMAQANMLYLTGFEDLFEQNVNAACLVTGESARLYTDFRYEEPAHKAAVGTPWAVYAPKEGMYIEICGQLREDGIETMALESSAPYGRFKYLSEQFVGHVKAVDSWVEDLRQIKETAEIERIEAAAALTDETFEHVLHFMKAGRTEKDVALEIEIFMRRNGSEGVAFEPIVASGANSAVPHAVPSDKVISEGDFVTLDMGARMGGYCSDMTRTVVMGKADDRQKEIYSAVLEAQLAALDAVKAGMPGCGLDQVARDLLAAKGLAEGFGHGLGHGVGLQVHELPTVNSKSKDAVRTGSVITIEPGVYLSGFGGVRIEDLVVVEESGARVLSHSPKDLIEL